MSSASHSTSKLSSIQPVSGRKAPLCIPGKESAQFLADMVAGLSRSPKSLPCKYLYDAEGSRLFDRICELPEYYPTRTELTILRKCLPEISQRVGPNAQVIEFGSGSGLKTQLLLAALREPTGCALVEISRSYLMECAAALRIKFPALQVEAICADYTQPFTLNSAPEGTSRRLGFFPGSTIGNFEPTEAREFLGRVARLVGRGGALLVGVDLQKDPRVLQLAYDDSAGVTAAFNLNVLARANRELGTRFRIDDFEHRAIYNAELSRIEMHLVSRHSLTVRLAGKTLTFRGGESLHTENSYKYTQESFAELAQVSGWRVETCWTDPARLFSVQFLVAS